TWYLNRRKNMDSGLNQHMITSDLDFAASNDVEREKLVMSWRGYRHMFGLRVRGQCTRTTGRKGGAVGVKKVKMMPGAVPGEAGAAPPAGGAAAPAAAGKEGAKGAAAATGGAGTKPGAGAAPAAGGSKPAAPAKEPAKKEVWCEVGDPRKAKKLYRRPRVIWTTDQLNAELCIIGSYGLRIEHELRKTQT